MVLIGITLTLGFALLGFLARREEGEYWNGWLFICTKRAVFTRRLS